jgi:hypothetical protein
MGQAQDTVRASNVKVGVGASVNASSIVTFNLVNANVVFPVGFMNILVPISFSHFRLEPEFGDFAMTSEVKSSSITVTERQGIIRMGLAAHYIHNFGDLSQFYVGPRFAVFMVNSSSGASNNPNDEETSWTDVLIGASLGGEYLFSKHFSIGAEVQMNYISHGDPEVKPEPSLKQEESGSILSNNAALIVRWYFN